MRCPCCATEMDGQTLEDRQGGTLAIDLCGACRVLWFDPYEDLRLSAGSTLKIVQIIAKEKTAEPPGPPTPPACPLCGLRLLVTHDQQHATKFEYLRCARGHGRLITFVNFLLEKDFIRPLSPEQVDELKARGIEVISCSKCGAPVDLTQGSTCRHCGAPLSMVDVGRLTAPDSKIVL